MPTTDRDRLLEMLTARHPCISINTCEEHHALDVIRQAAMEGRRDLLVWDCVNGLRDGVVKDAAAMPDTAHPAGGLARAEKHLRGDAIFCFLDLGEHFERDPAVRRIFREVVDRLARDGGSLVLIDHQEPPPLVRSLASHYELTYPGEEELRSIVRETAFHHHRNRKPLRVELKEPELDHLVNNLRGLTRRQAKQAVLDCIAGDQRLDAADIQNVLGHKKRSLAAGGLLEYVEAPTSMDEIGGLSRLKGWLVMRENALSEAAEAFGLLPPRGLLLLGVQGAGKSLAAKAVATAWQRPLLRLDVGALYDRYIGESERRLRDALRQAEMMAPCVLWIDEIEKAFASAASQSTDGGLSRRMFGSLLTWMQEHRHPVFLIATANDIEALPPELLRKGRFDEIFFVDLPTAEARRRIFEIHLRRRRRDPEKFDVEKLSEASEGYSGAEIEQAILSAMHSAFALGRELETQGIVDALRQSPPLSVTRAEQVEALRAWAADRCVPAD